MKKLSPERKNWLIASIRREHIINAKEKRILLIGISLESADAITRERIKLLIKYEKFKVYTQTTIF
jgi:hypothetical protein